MTKAAISPNKNITLRIEDSLQFAAGSFNPLSMHPSQWYQHWTSREYYSAMRKASGMDPQEEDLGRVRTGRVSSCTRHLDDRSCQGMISSAELPGEGIA
jgi:hypothetical protein